VSLQLLDLRPLTFVAVDYPHWDMKPELKAYYLVQAAYWTHQLLVTVLGMEKPRKDFRELVAHHLVTLWMVGWVICFGLFTFLIPFQAGATS